MRIINSSKTSYCMKIPTPKGITVIHVPANATVPDVDPSLANNPDFLRLTTGWGLRVEKNYSDKRALANAPVLSKEEPASTPDPTPVSEPASEPVSASEPAPVYIETDEPVEDNTPEPEEELEEEEPTAVEEIEVELHDPKNLQPLTKGELKGKYTMAELREICTDYSIDFSGVTKKKDIVDLLYRFLHGM